MVWSGGPRLLRLAKRCYRTRVDAKAFPALTVIATGRQLAQSVWCARAQRAQRGEPCSDAAHTGRQRGREREVAAVRRRRRARRARSLVAGLAVVLCVSIGGRERHRTCRALTRQQNSNACRSSRFGPRLPHHPQFLIAGAARRTSRIPYTEKSRTLDTGPAALDRQTTVAIVLLPAVAAAPRIYLQPPPAGPLLRLAHHRRLCSHPRPQLTRSPARHRPSLQHHASAAITLQRARSPRTHPWITHTAPRERRTPTWTPTGWPPT